MAGSEGENTRSALEFSHGNFYNDMFDHIHIYMYVYVCRIYVEYMYIVHVDIIVDVIDVGSYP